NDGCGNTSTAAQVIMVIDTTAPVVTTAQGADATIECPAAPVFSAPVFTDACQVVITPSAVTVTNTVGCTNIITRTWTASDGCGNSSTAAQVITVIDTTAPAISALPALSTIECPATPSFTTPTATDACDASPTLTFADVTTPGSCPQQSV